MSDARTFAAVVSFAIAVAPTLSACNQTAAQVAFTGQSQKVAAAKGEFKACRQRVREKAEYSELLKYHPDLETGQFSVEQLSNNNLATNEEARLYAKEYDEVSNCFSDFLSVIGQIRPDMLAIYMENQTEIKLAVVSLIEKKVTWGEFSEKISTVTLDDQKKLSAAETQYESNLQSQNGAELQRRRQAAMIYLQTMQNQQMINAVNRPIVTNCNAFGASVNCISQ